MKPPNSSSTRPLSWINPLEASFIRVDDGASFDCTELKSAISSHNITMRSITASLSPPWIDDALVDILELRNAPQLVILSRCISIYATAVATLAMEKGYDTFFVSPALSTASYADIARLQNIGTKIVLYDRFVAECQLSLS